MDKTSVRTGDFPAPVGPYSPALGAGGLLFVSGQLGIDPATGMLEAGVEAQAERALLNLRAVLAAAGASTADVARTTVLLADMADFRAVNQVYARFFTEPFPARAAFAVAGLPLGALVEIEATAVLGSD
jgi:2-iminobutanoate/2-iminopropanoate deaminase